MSICYQVGNDNCKTKHGMIFRIHGFTFWYINLNDRILSCEAYVTHYLLDTHVGFALHVLFSAFFSSIFDLFHI